MTGSRHIGDFEDALRLAKQGNGRAFDALYCSLNRRIFSFASARRAPDPEGLVNDTFLRVFQNLHTFTGTEDQFAGWVFRIARNLLFDESRKRSRRVTEVDYTASTEDPIDPLLVDDVVVSSVHAETLLAHLDNLTPDQRDVILLRVVADQSIETVAAALGKSKGGVKSLQRRALKTLEKEISRQAVSP